MTKQRREFIKDGVKLPSSPANIYFHVQFNNPLYTSFEYVWNGKCLHVKALCTSPWGYRWSFFLYHEVLMCQLKVTFFIFYQYWRLFLKICDFISLRRSGKEDETLKISVMELFFSRNVGWSSVNLLKMICEGLQQFFQLITSFLANLGRASFRKISQCLILLFFLQNTFLKESQMNRFGAFMPGYFSSCKFVKITNKNLFKVCHKNTRKRC